MHLNVVSCLVALSLATTAVADHLIVSQYCYLSCTYPATFITSVGRYDVNASDGCRSTSVPGMTEFRIDWRAARGHFKFSHQSHRWCLRETGSDETDCGLATCRSVYFDEVPCTWRLAEGEEAEEGPVASESATS